MVGRGPFGPGPAAIPGALVPNPQRPGYGTFQKPAPAPSRPGTTTKMCLCKLMRNGGRRK